MRWSTNSSRHIVSAVGAKTTDQRGGVVLDPVDGARRHRARSELPGLPARQDDLGRSPHLSEKLLTAGQTAKTVGRIGHMLRMMALPGFRATFSTAASPSIRRPFGDQGVHHSDNSPDLQEPTRPARHVASVA